MLTDKLEDGSSSNDGAPAKCGKCWQFGLRLVIGLKFTIQLGVDITTAAIMIDTNSQVPTITIDTNTPNLATAAIQINTNSRANKPDANIDRH